MSSKQSTWLLGQLLLQTVGMFSRSNIARNSELKTTIEQPTSQTHVTDSRARFSTFVNAIISKRGNLVRAKPQTTCIVKTSRRPNRAPLNRCLNNDVTFEPNIDPRDYNTTWAGTKSNRIQCSLVKKAGTLSRRSGGKKKKRTSPCQIADGIKTDSVTPNRPRANPPD